MTRGSEEVTITCYSGSKDPVFEDISTGMVEETKNGLYYKSKKTNKLTHVYLDCVLVVK